MERKAELILREDNILEITTNNFYQINLNNAFVLLIAVEEEGLSISINGVKLIQSIPTNYYEGLVRILKESKLYEIHEQNYSMVVRTSKDPSKTERQLLNDIFVNVNSNSILSVTEEQAYDENDTKKLKVDVVDKGMLVFFKEAR